MGVGAGVYMCDAVKKSSRSLSHLLMSSCLFSFRVQRQTLYFAAVVSFMTALCNTAGHYTLQPRYNADDGNQAKTQKEHYNKIGLPLVGCKLK